MIVLVLLTRENLSFEDSFVPLCSKTGLNTCRFWASHINLAIGPPHLPDDDKGILYDMKTNEKRGGDRLIFSWRETITRGEEDALGIQKWSLTLVRHNESKGILLSCLGLD